MLRLPLKEMLLQRLEMDGAGHFPPLRLSGALGVPTMNSFLLLFVVPVPQGHSPAQDLAVQVTIQAPRSRIRFPHAFGSYKQQKFL